MIPYEDLVSALSAWRAKQGLPVHDRGAASQGGQRASEGAIDVDDSLIAEAEDYSGDATSVGGPPSRPSDSFGGMTDVDPVGKAKTKGKKSSDW
jgi:hypothetical protein